MCAEQQTNKADQLVCVLCGRPWTPGCKNRCECGGFCTWGEKKGGKPSSWNVSETGKWTPKPVPKDVRDGQKSQA